PGKGSVLLSITDEKKAGFLPVARRLHEKGYRLYATSGTHSFLKQSGLVSTKVDKIGVSLCGAEYLIKKGRIDLVINLSSGRGNYSYGYRLRRLAYEKQIAIITTLPAARAIVQ
ncbi:MAG TPA: carbamoyl-phosphate synthase large chain, partial [bacterium]|nr:carbamoyl-phosphate synthase large chain [bacterium]